MTIIECHDCRIPLDSGEAYFDPIKVDKWVRCLDCHKSMREAIEVAIGGKPRTLHMRKLG